MAWDWDREPLEYLERRLRYYKRKIGSLKRELTQPVSKYLRDSFGSKKAYHNAIKIYLNKMELRVSQFNKAIEKLKK